MLRGRSAIVFLLMLLVLAVAGRIFVDAAFTGVIALIVYSLIVQLVKWPGRSGTYSPDRAPLADWWRARRERQRAR